MFSNDIQPINVVVNLLIRTSLTSFSSLTGRNLGVFGYLMYYFVKTHKEKLIK